MPGFNVRVPGFTSHSSSGPILALLTDLRGSGNGAALYCPAPCVGHLNRAANPWLFSPCLQPHRKETSRAEPSLCPSAYLSAFSTFITVKSNILRLEQKTKNKLWYYENAPPTPLCRMSVEQKIMCCMYIFLNLVERILNNFTVKKWSIFEKINMFPPM